MASGTRGRLCIAQAPAFRATIEVIRDFADPFLALGLARSDGLFRWCRRKRYTSSARGPADSALPC
jgi:hypothetical protein